MDTSNINYKIRPVSAIAVISEKIKDCNGIYHISYKNKTIKSDCNEVKFMAVTIQELIADIDETEYDEIKIIATYK